MRVKFIGGSADGQWFEIPVANPPYGIPPYSWSYPVPTEHQWWLDEPSPMAPMEPAYEVEQYVLFNLAKGMRYHYLYAPATWSIDKLLDELIDRA